jgi:hypothetical protein
MLKSALFTIKQDELLSKDKPLEFISTSILHAFKQVNPKITKELITVFTQLKGDSMSFWGEVDERPLLKEDILQTVANAVDHIGPNGEGLKAQITKTGTEVCIVIGFVYKEITPELLEKENPQHHKNVQRWMEIGT